MSWGGQVGGGKGGGDSCFHPGQSFVFQSVPAARTLLARAAVTWSFTSRKRWSQDDDSTLLYGRAATTTDVSQSVFGKPSVLTNTAARSWTGREGDSVAYHVCSVRKWDRNVIVRMMLHGNALIRFSKKPRSNLYVTTGFSLGPNPVAAWLASMASMAKNKNLPTLTRNERWYEMN